MNDEKGFDIRLVEIVKAIDVEFESLSYLDAGALFREHVAEYGSALDYLIRALGNLVEVSPEAVEQVCRRLCELSREVLFAGDVDRLPKTCVSAISALFRLAVDVICDVSKFPEFSQINKEVLVYQKNIEKRALGNPWDSIVIA